MKSGLHDSIGTSGDETPDFNDELHASLSSIIPFLPFSEQSHFIPPISQIIGNSFLHTLFRVIFDE
jgi:hypothetical protein